MHEDLALGADQKGLTDAAEVQRVDDVDQGIEAQIAAD
jgi:hypothetical protein